MRRGARPHTPLGRFPALSIMPRIECPPASRSGGRTAARRETVIRRSCVRCGCVRLKCGVGRRWARGVALRGHARTVTHFLPAGCRLPNPHPEAAPGGGPRPRSLCGAAFSARGCPAPCPRRSSASRFYSPWPFEASMRGSIYNSGIWTTLDFLLRHMLGGTAQPDAAPAPPPQPHTQKKARPELSLAPHGGPQHPWTSGTWGGAAVERSLPSEGICGRFRPRGCPGRVPEHLFSQPLQNTDPCARETVKGNRACDPHLEAGPAASADLGGPRARPPL